MTLFDQHTPETAPEGSLEQLAAVQNRFGFLPNIYGFMAESPAALTAYTTLGGLLAKTAFSPAEQQLMLMTISAFNGCEYCVAAHSMGARKAALAEDVIDAVRNGTPITDPKLARLSGFTRMVVEKRGHVGDGEIERFLAAGYSKAQALEVIMAVSFKTLSNYINHFAETPLDDAFAKARWTAPETDAAVDD